jgi:PleD family two-component response regulator
MGLADTRGGVRRLALLAAADRALYRAKAQGRDQVQRA